MSEPRKRWAGERWPGYNSKPRPRVLVEIPRWVPAALHEDYRTVAELDGEEAAASYARKRKREAGARR